MAGFLFLGMLCMFPLMLLGVLLQFWMLIDCLLNEPSQGNDKLIWVLVILLMPLVGSLLYLFVRRPYRMRNIIE